MWLVKTVRVKAFEPTRVKKQFMALLLENSRLMNEYLSLMQAHQTTSKQHLHLLSYERLTQALKLPAAVVQTARDKAVQIYRSHLAMKKDGPDCKLPCFRMTTPVRLDRRCFNIIETKNKLTYVAAMSVKGGRVHVPLLGQRYQYRQLRKIVAGELKLGSVELVKRGEDFYFHLAIKKETPDIDPDYSYTPVGVDLGLINLSTSVILKGGRPCNILFQRGGNALEMRKRFATFRASLSRAGKFRRIRETTGKERRCMRDINHKISKSILAQANQTEKPIIVMERLTYIRERIHRGKKLNAMLHGWAFAQLQEFIAYKAAWAGIPVMYINPKYTSQQCNKCGFTSKANRLGRSFKCGDCGYELNADLNAAINIAKAYKNFAPGYRSGALGARDSALTLQARA